MRQYDFVLVNAGTFTIRSDAFHQNLGCIAKCLGRLLINETFELHSTGLH